jgi:hypothetical protein
MYGHNQETQVRFLIGSNYEAGYKKNLLTSEAGVCGFSRPGEGSFFLLKTREAVLPHRALF